MQMFFSYLRVLALFCLFAAPLPSFAAAFQTYLQSANSLGYAHADMSSQGTDPSTAYYNPAAMVNFCRGAAEIGVIGYQQTNQYRSRLNPELPPEIEQEAIDGLNQFLESIGFNLNVDSLNFKLARADNNTFDTIPNIHIVQPIPCAPWNLTLGLSVVQPWKYESNYCNNLAINLYADKTSIQSIAINPSIAIKPLANLSLGVGFSMQEIKTYYSSSFGLFGYESKLRGWKSTWNVGALYELDGCTRFGATYRPRVTYDLHGNTKILSSRGNAKSRFVVPGTVSFGAYHQVDSCLSLMGTAVFTMWDKFRRLSVHSDVEPFLLDVVQIDVSNINIPMHWHSSWFIGLGGDYRINQQWMLKAGIAYDRTPTGQKHREIRIPDQDRFLLAFGLRYHFNDCLMFDFGYQYAYQPPTAIKHSKLIPFQLSSATDEPLPFAGLETSGHVQAHTSYIGGELVWKW